jgi:hypothetical protein
MRRLDTPNRTILSFAVIIAPTLMAQAPSTSLPSRTAQTCAEPYRVSREEIRQAMSTHGAYSLTSTTTSLRFGAEAILELARRRQREAPGSTQFLISQPDWFAAHLETAGVTYAEMSEAARAGFEHHQDALVDYGPGVVEQIEEGRVPIMSLDITLFLPDTGDAPSEFSYKDTLSVPRVDVYNERIVRSKLLDYGDMLVFDQVTGISVRPLGFLSAVFAVLGKPDLKQTRLTVSADEWQVLRARVKVFAGISKTGTATIEPGGRGHEGVPRERPDLRKLAQRIKQPLKLRYGEPSCQAEARMRRRGEEGGGGCRLVMGGAGACPEN